MKYSIVIDVDEQAGMAEVSSVWRGGIGNSTGVVKLAYSRVSSDLAGLLKEAMGDFEEDIMDLEEERKDEFFVKWQEAYR